MKSVAERLAMKTDSSGGPEACWPWTGAVGGSGTCCIQIDKKSLSARRVIWERTNGPVPAEHVVSDSCGFRQCVNPAHLTLRTFVLADRLFGFCDRTGGPDACWPYMRNRSRRGYGNFPIGEKGKHPAHRIAWEVTHGKIGDPSLFVCHRCDNPPCCNPAHLFLGTAADNHRDMEQKGRMSRGAKHAAIMASRPNLRRTTPEQQAEILRRRTAGETLVDVARAIGCSSGTVRNVELRAKDSRPNGSEAHRG